MRLDTWPGVAQLDPNRIRQFLRSRGWELDQDASRPPLLFYYHRGDETAVVVGRMMRDFARRTAELIEQLAEVHAQPVSELLDDLSAPIGDIIEVRIRSESVRDGTIPLDAAADYRKATQDLLLAALHAELQPQSHYARMSRREAVEVLGRCREGQSARGSYRIRTIVPMDPQVGQIDLDPLPRRAVMRLHRATTAAVEAVQTDRGDELLHMHEQGVSANLLAALGRLEPPGEGGTIDLAVRWSHAHTPPAGSHPPVHIDHSAFGHFRSAAESIRSSTPEPGFTLNGYVVRLESESERQGGTAYVIGDGADIAMRKIALTVAEVEYQRLVNAHRDGRKVTVSGTLTQHRRVYKLEDPRLISIDEDTPQTGD